MRILVTGAAGFVAKHLIPELEAYGHDIITTDVVPSVFGLPGYRLCDLCDAEAVLGLMDEVKPQGVIHLAGVSFVPDAAKDPGRLYAINVGGTINVLEALRQSSPGARFLFVSTAQVYGCTRDPDSAVLDETAELYPLTPYAVSKVAGEAATRGYGMHNGLFVNIARPSNHTGPGQPAKFIVPSLVEQAKSIKRGEKRTFVAGNIVSGRSFLDVRDVVAAYRIILESGTAGETYNVGVETCCTIGALLDTVKQVAGVDAPIETNPSLVRPTDFSRVLDTHKLRSLGWTPRYALEDTIRDMLT